MSANQFAIVAESAGQEERHHRCAMDPNPAQLWIVGEFVSTRRGVGGIAHVAASSRTVVGTSRAARVANAKGVVQMNVQLSQALSDVTGDTGQAIIRAIVA